jgi:Zn-dependent peptidase ImmA (M78 family)/transcriptional regulator with XRE-family HTH domain
MSTNGSMLRLARQRKQLSQIDAAKKLEIEQSLLSRIENGLVEARDEILTRASCLYEVPVTFFSLTDAVYGAPVSVHPMWRRKADVSVREMDAVVAELNIRSMHLRRLLEAAEFVHATDIPRLDIEDYKNAEAVASVLRAHWKLPAGPIRDLTVLIERAGVVVAHSQLNGASISGVTFAPPGLPPLIVLNGDQSADRLRFTLAHELGHMVMHRFPTPGMEEEANEFASALLMPAKDISPYFIGRRVDLGLLASLKREWKTSMQALLFRATRLGFVSQNQSAYLWKQISARGFRMREPPELDFAPEKPTVVDSLFQVHRETLGYTESDLSKFLHYFEADLRHQYGLRSEKPAQRVRLSVVK